jgi:hypothetical protein
MGRKKKKKAATVQKKFSKRRVAIPKAVKTGLALLACVTACGREVEVPADTRAVTCAYCTQAMVNPPEGYGEVKVDRTGWPRGWHRKKVFDGPDGVTYNKGVPLTKEVPVVQATAEKPKGRRVKKLLTS